MSTFFIAEAGVNHNGDESQAVELIRLAAESGADAVKFQTFSADALATATAQKAAYQQVQTGQAESQHAMLKKLELPHEAFLRLKVEADRLDIEFLSTAFDDDSLDFLVHEIGLSRLKIPSGEITNLPFVLNHARALQSGLTRQIILSTGMADLGDIEEALSVIAFGLVAEKNASPSLAAFAEAWSDPVARSAVQQQVCLLHCTTDYPANPLDVNLPAMLAMQSAFGTATGYSDHTEGTAVSVAAVALGATIIEKHFTLDKSLPGPDHAASLAPSELQQLIGDIRVTDQAMQGKFKICGAAERQNRQVVRKSLIAKRRIEPGQSFTDANVAIQRPASGLAPRHYWALLGRVSKKIYMPGDPIDE